MARCKHGIFLPENPKYKAEDVCSMCFSLSETANHYTNSPDSDLETVYQTGVDTDDTGLIRTISLIQMDRHTKQHIDDPIEQEFDAANVDTISVDEFMKLPGNVRIHIKSHDGLTKWFGNVENELRESELE
jgi:kynurenine formamidase